MSEALRVARAGGAEPGAAELRIDAADLVASAPAGHRLDALHQELAARGVWLALDPPVSAGATLGEVLESGAPGPLAALFGPPRDQVLGATFEAGAGIVARTGGRVVKNVAGFDLAKLIVGGRGAFGRLREVHLRLRAVPQADRTLGWAGSRQQIAAATTRLMMGSAMLASCEVLSPGLAHSSGAGRGWTLLARAMGTAAGLDEELHATASALDGCAAVTVPPDAWSRWQGAVCAWPAVARIGADPAAWSDAVDLATEAGAGDASVTVPRGTVRVSLGAGSAEAVRRLRAACARRGWPVTLERADARTLAEAGTWGGMNDGTLRLAATLRKALDPGGTPALWA